MYKKYLIISSKEDPASMNIVNQLNQFRPNPLLESMKKPDTEKPIFDIYTLENSMLETENLDHEKINKYDFVIFASKHQSKKEEKSLSVHTPGNFRTADAGGIKGKVCPSSALLNKFMFEKLNEIAEEQNLHEFNITMEATHHGPLIDVPCVFIEIGSTLLEWKNSRAGFIIAKTIHETVEKFKPSKYPEVAIGIGGPHYCPGFNKLQKDSNVAFSHIIPQYAMPITEEMIKETLNKTEEDYDFVVIDWKGLGISEERQRVINILEKNYIQWKKVSDINR
jgi:D-aminoacyl-tRNA deacylase